MRLHRFYVSQEIGNETEITVDSAPLVHQVRRVFRLKVGDEIVIFNGTGFDYLCKIDSFGGRSTIDSVRQIHLIVTSVGRSAFSPNRKLFLVTALVKKDTFEFIVEKATELGVTDIIPVIAERTEKKAVNMERLKAIAVEASEQSGRGDVPMIHNIMGPEDAVQFLKRQDVSLLVFHTEGERFERGLISDKNVPLGIFIGPEGGWSPSEIDMFHKEEIEVRSLGTQVLRAETAVVAALSLVVFDVK